MFFKIVFGNEIHVLNAGSSVTYSKISEFIKTVFKILPSRYNITYKDADGDAICLFNDLDLKILLESGANKVRLEIQETSEDFYDETQEINIGGKVEEQIQIVEVKEEEKKLMDESEVVPHLQNLDDSISEKISKMIPTLVSQVREEIMSESKMFAKKPEVINDPVLPELATEKSEIIEEPVEQNPSNIHKNFVCDECGCDPIIGVRYKCAVCADFDLCEKCEATTKHDHPFLKIKHVKQTPLKIITILDSEEQSIEFNGQRVSVPFKEIGQCINMFGNMFNGGRGRCPRRNFSDCREKMREMGQKMRQMNKKREAEAEKIEKVQKVEEAEKVEEKKQEPKVEEICRDQPIIIEQNLAPRREETFSRERQKNNESEEAALIEVANYLSEIIGVDFQTSMSYAKTNKGLSKEAVLESYLNGI